MNINEMFPERIPTKNEKETYYNLFQYLFRKEFHKLNVKIGVLSDTEYELYYFDQPILRFRIEYLDTRKLLIGFKFDDDELCITKETLEISKAIYIIDQYYKLRMYCFDKVVDFYKEVEEKLQYHCVCRNIEKDGRDALLIKNKDTGKMAIMTYGISHVMKGENKHIHFVKIFVGNELHTEEFGILDDLEIYKAIDFYVK